MPTPTISRSFRATTLLALAGVLSAGGSALGDVVYQADFEGGTAGSEWSDTTVGAEGGPFGTYLGNFGAGTVTLTLGGDDGSGGGNPGGPGGVTNNGGVRPQPGHRGGGGGDARGAGGGLKGYADAVHVLGSGGNGGGGGGNPGGGLGAGMYNITFDLYLFDSWDGRDPVHGIDRFEVIANGSKVFDEALETFEPHENWYGGWETAGNEAYSDTYRDLIYRAISLNFTVAEGDDAITIDFISKQNQGILDESWGLDNVRVTQTNIRSASASVPAGPTAMVLLGGLLCGVRRRR